MPDNELLEKAKIIRHNVMKRYNYQGPEIRTLLVVRNGNFTTAIINGNVVGTAKRNAKDKPSFTTGAYTAITRAVHYLLK